MIVHVDVIKGKFYLELFKPYVTAILQIVKLDDLSKLKQTHKLSPYKKIRKIVGFVKLHEALKKQFKGKATYYRGLLINKAKTLSQKEPCSIF